MNFCTIFNTEMLYIGVCVCVCGFDDQFGLYFRKFRCGFDMVDPRYLLTLVGCPRDKI